MSREAKEYIKDWFEKGVELGENSDISPQEAARQLMQNLKEEYASAGSYARCRKLRKEAVARRLGDIRKRRELKQQDVAAQTGINVVTLSGYEIGKNEPNMEALVRLANTYHVTLDYLMCRTDDPEEK